MAFNIFSAVEDTFKDVKKVMIPPWGGNAPTHMEESIWIRIQVEGVLLLEPLL